MKRTTGRNQKIQNLNQCIAWLICNADAAFSDLMKLTWEKKKKLSIDLCDLFKRFFTITEIDHSHFK